MNCLTSQLILFTRFRHQLLQISIQFTIGQILTRLGGAEELLVDLHLTDYALNRPISMFFIPQNVPDLTFQKKGSSGEGRFARGLLIADQYKIAQFLAT